MNKITKQQRRILSQLIYIEPFDVLLEETELQKGELRDELIKLINYGFIEVQGQPSVTSSTLRFYDSDQMNLCTFRATKRGLKLI